MRTIKIFAEDELRDYLNGRLSDAKSELMNEPKNRLLNVNEADYIDYLVSKYSAQLVEIAWEGISVSEREEMISARRHPSNFYVHQGKSYPRQIITYHIPYVGNSDLLIQMPNSRILWTTEVRLTSEDIRFDLINWRGDPEEIKREADSTIGKMKRQFQSVERETNAWNSQLGGQIKKMVQERKTKLLEQLEILGQLGVPVKKSENVPSTFSVPVQKKKPIIQMPKSSDEPFTPEPVLDQDTYDAIVQICLDMGVEMERHPSVYFEKDEEDLRDHFIMQLSPHFQSVSGETFNRSGKTDILIRHNSGNVFVAECKFWRGQKSFGEAVDQLLSYLTWRDSKAAILLFVKNKEFSPVLEKIDKAIEGHKCFVIKDASEGEALVRYRFHLPGDETRGIQLTVLAFHFAE